MRTIIIGGVVAMLGIQASAGARDVRIATVPVHASDRADPVPLRARVLKAIDAACGTYAGAPYAHWTDIGRCRREAKAAGERQIAEMIERDRATRLAIAR